MDVNVTAVSLVTTLLQDSKIGYLTDKILLGLGGIASATIIYFIIMVTLQYRTYKVHKHNNEILCKLERIHDDTNNKKN